jgi:hypothetical protein
LGSGQFYLVWHANYNDTEIVCNAEAAAAIVDRINSQDFGMKMDLHAVDINEENLIPYDCGVRF